MSDSEITYAAEMQMPRPTNASIKATTPPPTRPPMPRPTEVPTEVPTPPLMAPPTPAPIPLAPTPPPMLLSNNADATSYYYPPPHPITIHPCPQYLH